MDLDIVPEHRVGPLRQLIDKLQAAQRIALITHVNADGDGAGSEAAVAMWLRSLGKQVNITNPTVYPELFRYLIAHDDIVLDYTNPQAAEVIRSADLVFVLDTGERKRIGRHMDMVVERPTVVLDHHPASAGAFDGLNVLDTTACATGELVFDLLTTAGFSGEWPAQVTEAIYTAICTDTGSFRFANTTPRAHAIAGDMIRRGVDPELMYRRLYGTVPMRRIKLLREALDNLEADDELPLTWILITRKAMAESGASSDDIEGVVEYARSIEGTELAILFRETNDGSTKISFRSNGDMDVNALARKFGGGGHVKAAGAVVGEPIADTKQKVLDAAREAMRRTLK
jgi:bifunctional oligoribonuclease and PAP phosphatase NrnA